MENKLKRRIFFGICSIVVTVIATLCVAIGLLASNILGKNSSGFVANYSCDHVCAAVSATGKVDGMESFNFVSNHQSTVIVLDENKNSAAFAAVEDICLTSTNRAVTFEYKFENRGEEAFCVFATLPEIVKNVSVEETNSRGELIENHQLVVESGETQIYRLRVSIKSLANSAQFGGAFNFVLTSIF